MMMGSNYKEEMKKIKERYDDMIQKNGAADDENEAEENGRGASKKFFHFEQENELNERSNSFRLNSYAAAAVAEKDKFSTLKKTLKRFVIVIVFVSVICGTVYLASRWLAKKRLKTYVLRGNETHFESFQGLPVPPDELGAIWLQNVELAGPDLVQALRGYNRLTSITLNNVKIQSDFDDTVLLPSLTDFVYAETIEKKSIVDIMSTMTEPKLKSIIFFRNEKYLGEEREGGVVKKGAVEELDLSRLWDFGVNINVTLEGYSILALNHTREELVLPWLTYLKREALVRNAGRGVRRLACNRLRLSIDAIHPQVTHLTLRDVKLVGGDFGMLVRKLYKLKELRVSFGEVTTVELSDFPWRTLRTLSLSRAALTTSKAGKKSKLKSLTLLSPNLSWEVVREFDNLFHVSELAISEYHINVNESQQSEQHTEEEPNRLLLRNALKTEAERVLMYKFRWVTNTSSNDNNNQREDDGAMERWLNATGIPRGISSFVLEKIASQWNLRNLDWNEWSSYKHHAMGWDKFWSHAGSI